MRTLVIGIDAACDRVLDPLFEAGELPNLRELINEGVAGELESSVPPWTPSAWPSIYTGVNPGKHGVFGFLSFDGYDWDVVDATNVREHTLWELLDNEGYSSVVVNAPITHPPREFDGALLPGYTAPEDPTCHPEGLLEHLEEAIGPYRLYPDAEPDENAPYCDVVRMRGEAFRHLRREYDPDFGFVQFQQTDTVFHERPGDWDLVRDVYGTVDEQIGRILADADPDNVLVISDHGMGEYDGYGFRVNEFLAEHGYVEVTRGGRMPSWVPIRENRLRASGDNGDRDDVQPGRDPLAGLVGAAGAIGVTPERVGHALDVVGLREPVARAMPDHLVSAGSRRVDFANSVAYMRARIELGVRINLEGREPDGVVPTDEYEAVRDELIDRFDAVETPDGDPVFERVDRREAFYDGPWTEEAVDVVTIPTDYDHFLTASLHGDVFGDPGQPWNHKSQGTIVATGEDVDGTAPPADASVFDVAPTVLATFGLGTGDRMDGAALPFVEDQGTQRYPEYEPTAETGAAGQGVESRLEKLGYIE